MMLARDIFGSTLGRPISRGRLFSMPGSTLRTSLRGHLSSWELGPDLPGLLGSISSAPACCSILDKKSGCTHLGTGKVPSLLTTLAISRKASNRNRQRTMRPPENTPDKCDVETVVLTLASGCG